MTLQRRVIEPLRCRTEKWFNSWKFHEMKHFYVILLVFLAKTSIFGQNSKGFDNTTRIDSLVFSDTLWLKTIAGERTNHYLLVTENPYLWENTPRQNCYKTYYFKVGNEDLEIYRAFTGDPHYIDNYPREVLKAGSIYSYSVRFHFQNRIGPYIKVMGFEFINGEFAFFTFKGNVN